MQAGIDNSNDENNLWILQIALEPDGFENYAISKGKDKNPDIYKKGMSKKDTIKISSLLRQSRVIPTYVIVNHGKHPPGFLTNDYAVRIGESNTKCGNSNE
jgi:hypothetical protein